MHGSGEPCVTPDTHWRTTVGPYPAVYDNDRRAQKALKAVAVVQGRQGSSGVP